MTRPARPTKGWLAHYSELAGTWRRKHFGREDGEDAMHDTVLGMLENGVAAIEDPRAYLARGTHNRLISRHRHVVALPFTPIDDLGDGEHPTMAGADSGAQFQQLADALQAALEDLPPKCRQIYIKHRLEGWTHSEIAEQMGLSRSMVEKHMTRALRTINAQLQNHLPH